MSDNSRRAVRRGTWHFQTSNGSFVPFPESTAALLHQSFLRPSEPRPHDALSRAASAQTRYGLPVQEAVVDVGNGRCVERLESGIIVQRRTGNVPSESALRLVVDGRPKMIHGRPGDGFRRAPASRPHSSFSMFSDMGSVTPFASSRNGSEWSLARGAEDGKGRHVEEGGQVTPGEIKSLIDIATPRSYSDDLRAGGVKPEEVLIV